MKVLEEKVTWFKNEYDSFKKNSKEMADTYKEIINTYRQSKNDRKH